MQSAQPATPAVPFNLIVVAAVLTVVVVISGLFASGALKLPGIGLPQTPGDVSPLLVRAEKEWEKQRHQMSGYVDPLIRAEQEWERIRRQISGEVR